MVTCPDHNDMYPQTKVRVDRVESTWVCQLRFLHIHHDTMYKERNVSHFLLSGEQIAINSTVIKRPASALTQSALDAHGENTEMSLEEKMKRIQDSQDIFILFNSLFN